jgi:hypothetical protein
MSNIVDFIARLGQDSHLRYAASSDVERELQRAGIPSELQAALLAADPRRLEALLGVQSNVCCMVHAPDDEEEDEEEDDAEEEEDEELTLRHPAVRRVASAG